MLNRAKTLLTLLTRPWSPTTSLSRLLPTVPVLSSMMRYGMSPQGFQRRGESTLRPFVIIHACSFGARRCTSLSYTFCSDHVQRDFCCPAYTVAKVTKQECLE